MVGETKAANPGGVNSKVQVASTVRQTIRPFQPGHFGLTGRPASSGALCPDRKKVEQKFVTTFQKLSNEKTFIQFHPKKNSEAE